MLAGSEAIASFTSLTGSGLASKWGKSEAHRNRSAPAAMVPLRSFMRQRETLVEETATRIHRMQKALTQMNVMLHLVVTDITGQTGLKIVRSILAGERDPQRHAAHRDRRCHASYAEIVAGISVLTHLM